MKRFTLHDFVAESNRIEGIETVRDMEVEAHEHFLAQPITVQSLEFFVLTVADALLRSKQGMNVRAGNHHPVAGGPMVRDLLQNLLDNPTVSAFEAHRAYEAIHPFMDGNGRSGRVLWLHMMGGIEKVSLGFLHTFYYQSLDNRR